MRKLLLIMMMIMMSSRRSELIYLKSLSLSLLSVRR